jgi:molybdopterin-guanine dinucleotide biosynthesis protein A
LQHQIFRLASDFREVLVLTGRPRTAESLGLADTKGNIRYLADPHGYEGSGPMAGLLAALVHSRTEWIAMMPVDCPHFPGSGFFELLRLGGPEIRAAGFLDGGGRPQWLPGLYHRDLQGSLQASLDAGQFCFRDWLQTVPHAFFPCRGGEDSMLTIFTNLNTAEQAATAGYALPQQAEPPVRVP